MLGFKQQRMHMFGVFQLPENGDSLLQSRKARVWPVVDEVYEQFGRV
jgi:hypothetical protein